MLFCSSEIQRVLIVLPRPLFMNLYQPLKVGYGSSNITASDGVFQDINRITKGDICDKS